MIAQPCLCKRLWLQEREHKEDQHLDNLVGLCLEGRIHKEIHIKLVVEVEIVVEFEPREAYK